MPKHSPRIAEAIARALARRERREQKLARVALSDRERSRHLHRAQLLAARRATL